MGDFSKFKRILFVIFCMHAMACAGVALIGSLVLTSIGWDFMGGYGVHVFYVVFFALSYFPARKIKHIN